MAWTSDLFWAKQGKITTGSTCGHSWNETELTEKKPYGTLNAAMQRAARSAQDLAKKTNTSILVVVDGKNVQIQAAELIKMRESEGQIRHQASCTSDGPTEVIAGNLI